MCFWRVCLGWLWRLDGEGSVLRSLFAAMNGWLRAPIVLKIVVVWLVVARVDKACR